MPGTTDNVYEQQFFQVALPQIRDKAPALVRHFIAFQMLQGSKSDDDTRAAGVFIFKVGPEIILCPVFFINGELKGYDMMILRSSESFLPLTEDWVDRVVSRSDRTAGAPAEAPRDRLGLRQPDFSVFSRPPLIGSKMGSAAERIETRYGILNAACDVLARHLDTPPTREEYKDLDARMDLRSALPRLGVKAACAFFRAVRRNLGFADAVCAHYDLAELGTLCKQAAAARHTILFDDVPNAPKTKPMRVEVVLKDQWSDTPPPGLSDVQKEKLLRDGYTVRDDRDSREKGKLFRPRLDLRLQSPDSSGVWEVLTPDGKTRPMIVAVDTLKVGTEPGSPDHFCTVIDPEAKASGNYRPDEVLCARRIRDLQPAEKGTVPADELKSGDVAILIGPAGKVTNIFQVENRIDRADGTRELRICAMPHPSAASYSRDFAVPVRHWDTREWPESRIEAIVLTGRKGGRPQQIARALFLPDGFRAFVVEHLDKPFYGDRKGPASLVLGSLNDVARHVEKAAEAGAITRLRASLRSGTWVLQAGNRTREEHTKAAAVRSLVLGLGLDVGDAEHVLDEAEAASRTGGMFEVLVKAGDTPQPDPAVFWDPPVEHGSDMKYPVQYPWTEAQVISRPDSQLAAETHRIDPWVDDAALYFAQQGAAQGRKEVADVSTVAALVRSSNVDGEVAAALPDIRQAMNRYGRLQLHFYWHNDKVRKLFGQQAVASLEDNLRSVFRLTGDVVLDLEGKAVGSDLFGVDGRERLTDEKL